MVRRSDRAELGDARGPLMGHFSLWSRTLAQPKHCPVCCQYYQHSTEGGRERGRGRERYREKERERKRARERLARKRNRGWE